MQIKKEKLSQFFFKYNTKYDSIIYKISIRRFKNLYEDRNSSLIH